MMPIAITIAGIRNPVRWPRITIAADHTTTPLSTIGFSTLAPERRTDASGLYSLLRQLGSASGVAMMTAVLRVRLDAHLSGLAGEFAGGHA